MLKFKNFKKNILSGEIFIQVGAFFGGNMKNILFLLFFFLSAYCGYLWYAYVYNPQWSGAKKMEYLKTKDNEVTFNRKKFQDIIEKEKKRAEEYNRPVDQPNDIFRITRDRALIEQQAALQVQPEVQTEAQSKIQSQQAPSL